MKERKKETRLTRREEQIMNIIFRLGQASVADIMERLPGAPTSGAVRRMLNILYAKKCVDYEHDGAKKIYRSRIKRRDAGQKALKHVVETFFAGSASRTMASLFENSDIKLSEDEKKELLKLIKISKEKGR